MPLRLGLLVYPLLVFAATASQKGMLSKFVKAGADAPERARKPSSHPFHLLRPTTRLTSDQKP